MTMIKRRQAQTTDSIALNPAGLELSKIGYQSNRFSQSDVDFWKANLAGAPPLLELPTDRPRPTVLSFAGGRVGLALTSELTAGVRDLGQRHGATLFMTLLSGWSVLLSKLSGQCDFVIGTPVANRQRSEIEPLTGSSANTLALRVRLTPDPSVADLLAQIKSSTLQAYAHQGVPFIEVVDALELPCSLSYNPIFQVMLALDNAPEEPQVSRPMVTIGDLPQEHIKAKFDLTLSLRDAGKCITGYLEYASDLFESSTIVRMAEQLRTVLEAMVADDQQQIGELNLLSQPERQQVLPGWNETAASFPSEPLPELLPKQVGHAPGTDAFVDGTRQHFYAELDGAADSLAATLQQRNAKLIAARTRADAAAATARERIATLEAEIRVQNKKLRELRTRSGTREVELSAALRTEQQRNAELDAARVQAEAVAATACERMISLEVQNEAQSENLHQLRAPSVDREEELSSAPLTEQQRTAELDAARVQAEAAAATMRERIVALEAETRQQAESLHELHVQFGAVRDSLSESNALIKGVEAEATSSVAMLGNIQHNVEHLGGEEPAHILVPTDGESGIVHLLGERTTIGSTPDNDVQIDAKYISRRHAVARRDGANTVIEDRNSTNGTYVNGQRVNRHTLKDGDLVTLGKTEFRFSVTRPPA
jgi:hypothetical protein